MTTPIHLFKIDLVKNNFRIKLAKGTMVLADFDASEDNPQRACLKSASKALFKALRLVGSEVTLLNSGDKFNSLISTDEPTSYLQASFGQETSSVHIGFEYKSDEIRKSDSFQDFSKASKNGSDAEILQRYLEKIVLFNELRIAHSIVDSELNNTHSIVSQKNFA